MTRTNMATTRVRPDAAHTLLARVLRRRRLSGGFVRVTVGGADVSGFTPMGFDQWFRLFLPVDDGALTRLPQRVDTASYLRYLAVPKGRRPLMRNYTVAGRRDDGLDGPELDIDFVVHGGGAAAAWAQTCRPGAAVALFDEGITYRPPADCGDATVIVADESGLPAAAGVLAALAPHVYGVAVLEVAGADDRRDLPAPVGVDVRWIVRGTTPSTPGALALHAASAMPAPDASAYAWVVGEQGLVAGMRRHWVHGGLPKAHITFTGYWRHR